MVARCLYDEAQLRFRCLPEDSFWPRDPLQRRHSGEKAVLRRLPMRFRRVSSQTCSTSFGSFEKSGFHRQRHFKNPCFNKVFRSNACGQAVSYEVPIWDWQRLRTGNMPAPLSIILFAPQIILLLRHQKTAPGRESSACRPYGRSVSLVPLPLSLRAQSKAHVRAGAGMGPVVSRMADQSSIFRLSSTPLIRSSRVMAASSSSILLTPMITVRMSSTSPSSSATGAMK